MPELLIEISEDLPKGKYSFDLKPVLTPVSPQDPPLVVDPPIIDPPDEPVDSDPKVVPRIINQTLLWEGDSIGSNTILPFHFAGKSYLVSYSAVTRKNKLYTFNPSTREVKHQLNLDIIKDGKEVRGFVTAIVSHRGELIGLVEIEKRIFIIKAVDPNKSLKAWEIKNEIMIEGSKDTHHELYYNPERDLWVINGRLRNRDWNTTNSIKFDSRGVRVLESKNGSIHSAFDEKKGLRLDPVDLQPNYMTSDIRWDLYGSRVLIIQDNDGKQLLFTAINVFHKNSKRPPSTRPDRAETGTGELYPRWFVHGKLFVDSPVDLKFHERSWPLPECEKWNPEVGQIYILGFLQNGDRIYVFYSHRKDPHYLAFEDQPPTEIWVGELDRTELVEWYRSAAKA